MDSKNDTKNINDYDRILTSRGYAIKKSILDSKDEEFLRKSLTVKPNIPGRFAKNVDSFPIYMESNTRFYLPRQWAISNYGTPDISIVPDGLDMPSTISFKGKPFDYQENIIKAFMDANCQGLLCVPCGKGKTFMALAIAVRLKKRFLVVVDKEFLMNQWKGEMENFIEGLRVGILQGDKTQIDPTKYDCTICMLQTLAGRDFNDKFFHEYGFTIFDECHHLGAAHFSRALLKIQTKYILGLSATPTREDGLSSVFEAFIGKPAYWEKIREPDPDVVVRAVFYDSPCDDYQEVPVNWKGEPITARLLGQIVKWEDRTDTIIKICREICADSRRQILMLSERKEHLEAFEKALEQEPKIKTGYYIGGMKDEVRERNAKEAQVLLATYAMASDALNIKTLNAVILASPRKNVEQSTGRILRLRPDQREVVPVIVDIIDSHDMYVRQWYKRKAYYSKCKYTIKNEGVAAPKEKKKKEEAISEECLF
jgi:superfamily II DNA or RNA helicase